MAIYLSAMRGTPVTLQSAASATGNGVAIAIPPNFNNHKINIKTSAGVASGGVTPQSADDPSYTGTWNGITSEITVPAASSELEYVFQGRYSAIRCPITTIIGGGTVTVTYTGAP